MSLKVLKTSKYLVGLYVNQLAKDYNLAACLYSLANQSKPVDVIIYTNGLSADDVKTIKELADKPFVVAFKNDENGAPKEKRIESTSPVNYTLVESNSPMNFAQFFNSVFNVAVENSYEGISLIEAEDAYSLKWFEVADKYIAENPNIGIFAPLIKNLTGGVFSGLMNESPWVEGMSEEAGKFDLNLLQRFNCLNPLGAIYRVSAISEYAEPAKDENNNPINNQFKPMKESMKLSHYYEFFLRMIYDDVKAMTVPRIGYEMKTLNKNSFEDSSCKVPQNLVALAPDKGGMSPDEARFWFELAKKEFFYDEDRKKIYEPSA